MSRAASWTAGRDLSFSSSGKVLYFFVSYVASASEIALVTSANSLSREKEIWLEPEPKSLLDILFDKGGKMSVEEVGKEGEGYIGVE